MSNRIWINITIMLIQELKYIIQSAHINFLYGSGVSRPYLTTLGNIENNLTQLEKANLDKIVYNSLKASLYKAYCEGVIIPNYKFPHGNPDLIKTEKAYRDFFHIWNEIINKRNSQLLDKQINLFTTNIDLIVEDTLKGASLELNDGFRGTISPIFGESNFQISLSKSSLQYHKYSEVPIFNLIKIHGAVNWELQQNNIVSDIYRSGRLKELLDKIPADSFISLEKTLSDGTIKDKAFDELVEEAKKKKLSDAKIFDKFFDEYDKIVMINPTKEKFKTSVMDYHFYEMMRIFSNSLERENSVLFVIGFSFADEHIAEITRRAAAVNPTLQVIVFTYDDNDVNSYLDHLNITGQGANNNILILTPSGLKEANQKDENYKELFKGLDHFDLNSINRVFHSIGSSIHSSL